MQKPMQLVNLLLINVREAARSIHSMILQIVEVMVTIMTASNHEGRMISKIDTSPKEEISIRERGVVVEVLPIKEIPKNIEMK